MFSEEILIEIFKDKEAKRVPLVYQSTMIHVIERVLDDTTTNQHENNHNDNG